jgi:hypothetical protein
MSNGHLDNKILELQNFLNNSCLTISSSSIKILEYDLVKNFIESLQRNSTIDDIQDSYNSYHSLVRNLSCLSREYNQRLYEYTSEVYRKWKDKTNQTIL